MKLTRRAFGRTALLVGILPALRGSSRALSQEPTQAPDVPPTISGYTLLPEERELATKFLEEHEKSMAPVRAIELPNGLPPSPRFASPRMKAGHD